MVILLLVDGLDLQSELYRLNTALVLVENHILLNSLLKSLSIFKFARTVRTHEEEQDSS